MSAVKTIGVPHIEYLVNFNYLDKIMEEYGFSKVRIKPFEEYHTELLEGKNIMDLTPKELEKDIVAAKKMSVEEKRFSFFSSGFMYKKEHNSADSLMKKLIELIHRLALEYYHKDYILNFESIKLQFKRYYWKDIVKAFQQKIILAENSSNPDEVQKILAQFQKLKATF